MAKRLGRAGLPLACVPTLDTFKVGDIEGPARKLLPQAELSRGKNHAQNATTTHESLLSLAADSAGADANKNHNNQPCKHFHVHILGVCLCISGWTGRLWLSRHRFSPPRPFFACCSKAQVDCFDLCFLTQQHANQAETFACVASAMVSASLGNAHVCVSPSCKCAAARSGGHTTTSFVREKKWTDVGLSVVVRQRERS